MFVLAGGSLFGQADWTQLNPAMSPPSRDSSAMAQFGNGSQVVLFGGAVHYFGVPQPAILGDTWIWNGAAWGEVTSFSPIPVHPAARIGASMAYDPGNKRTVLFGGVGANGILSDTWLFSSQLFCQGVLCTTRYQWTQLTFAAGASPPGRYDASMAFDPSIGGIVLTGGSVGTQVFNDTWVFNGSTNTWTLSRFGAPVPSRSLAPMAQCDNGTVAGNAMFFGGSPYGDVPFGFALDDTWGVFPVAGSFKWEQSLPSPRPLARFGHGMAYYPVSKFDVLFGGNSGTLDGPFLNLDNDTWNGSCNTSPTWTRVSPMDAPRERWRHAMTTGPNGLKIVMFGGINNLNQSLGDTWVWGRLVACLPGDGSQIPMHSEVNCQFDPAGVNQFGGWTTSGFKLVPQGSEDANSQNDGEDRDSNDQLMVSFRAKGPGAASITAAWMDQTGVHQQTFTYTITPSQH
jgi:hypothetical protein